MAEQAGHHSERKAPRDRRRLVPNERKKLSPTWQTGIRTVTSRTEGATVEWRWDFSTTKTVDILRWMQTPLSDRLQYR